MVLRPYYIIVKYATAYFYGFILQKEKLRGYAYQKVVFLTFTNNKNNTLVILDRNTAYFIEVKFNKKLINNKNIYTKIYSNMYKIQSIK